jgi:metal transporter CNNM
VNLDFTGLCPTDEKEYISISTDTSSLFSIDTEYFSARTTNVIKQDENLPPQYKRREQGDGNVLHENVEFNPGNSDEEVIGIITMKDVMEEILQVMLKCYS